MRVLNENTRKEPIYKKMLCLKTTQSAHTCHTRTHTHTHFFLNSFNLLMKKITEQILKNNMNFKNYMSLSVKTPTTHRGKGTKGMNFMLKLMNQEQPRFTNEK